MLAGLRGQSAEPGKAINECVGKTDKSLSTVMPICQQPAEAKMPNQLKPHDISLGTPTSPAGRARKDPIAHGHVACHSLTRHKLLQYQTVA